jgi:hypothetical protein
MFFRLRGKIMEKRSIILVLGWLFLGSMVSLSGQSIVSVQSGNWGTSTTWEGGIVPTENDSVTICSGDTVVVESSGKKCRTLYVATGGILYANKSTTTSYPRNIYVYGAIMCDGQIGNDTIYDLIAFNLEGHECPISGSGHFDAARIRKYTNTHDTTTVTISMDLSLRLGGTAICNKRSGTVLIVAIDSGYTVSIPGDGISNGNVAMDGENGAASSTGGGYFQISGILDVSGIFYMTNSNSANPVSVEILEGGFVETGSIVCTNSGASGHSLYVHEEGVLKLTHGDWGTIGFTNNTYSFSENSLVWYAGDTIQVVGNPGIYGDLRISNPAIKLLQDNLAVSGNLTIQDGASLEAEAGTQITVSDTLKLEGYAQIALQSPGDSGASASMIVEGSVWGSGTLTTERWIKGYNSNDDGWYHMIASPVSNQPIQPGFVSQPPDPLVDFYRWDMPTNTWINSKNATGGWNTSFQAGDDRTFHTGIGYLAAYPQDIIKSFSGQPHQGDVSPEISSGSGFSGFFLIGNPFSSALQGSIDSWEKSNVDNAIWVWDGASGNYLTWNGSVGTLPGGVIPCMQGFFVHGNAIDPTLTIPASSQIHAPNTPFLKNDSGTFIKLTVSSGEYQDGVVLYECQAASPTYDPLFDVLKMNGLSNAPQLYWVEGTNRLSIDGRPEFQDGTRLSLGVSVATNALCHLIVEGGDFFVYPKTLHLKDLVTGSFIDLRKTNSYAFDALANQEEPRFQLIVGAEQPISEPVTNTPWQIIFNKEKLVVDGIRPNDGKVLIMVTDSRGRILLNDHVTNGSSFTLPSLSPGWYFVRLSSDSQQATQKYFITN